MKQKRNMSMRLLSLVLTLLLVFAAVPASAIRTEAAAKPKLKANVTVKEGKTKAVKITKNGFAIKAVKVKSEDKSIVTAKANKNNIKVTGVSAGTAEVQTTIRAKKNGIVKTFNYTTNVTVKEAAATTDTTPVDTTPTDTTPVNPTPTGTAATVNTQTELDAALADSSIKTITIGSDTTSLIIASAVYADKALIVDAPKASITNLATFKSIEIRNISTNTWTERASGNQFTISSAQPIRFLAPANYNITGIQFTGQSTSGTSNVIIYGGVVGQISVEAKRNVNVSAIGTATITKIGVTTNATVGVNCSDNAIIKTIETPDVGSSLTVGTSGKSSISDIKLTHVNSGAMRTSLNVVSAQNSAIAAIEVSSPYATASVTENDSSRITNLRVTDSSTVIVNGNAGNQIYVDLNSATANTRVTLNTTAVRVELGYGLLPDAIITNTSSANISVTYYNGSSRTTTTVASKNASRTNNTLTVSKVTNATNQIVATLGTAVNGLNTSNFHLYAMNGMYITNASTTDNGKTYILTLNTAIIANEKYTVEITGLDTTKFYNANLSASFSTVSESIRLNKTTLTATDAQIGTTEKLIAEVLPSDGLSRIPSWYSSDTNVATVDSNGMVTFKGVGVATITAYYGIVSASCKVTVTSAAKNSPYILVKNQETGSVIDSVIKVKLNGSINLTLSVEDIGTATIKIWNLSSSHERVSVAKTNGYNFRISSTLEEGVSSTITISVTLSNGQVLTKSITFDADMAGES